MSVIHNIFFFIVAIGVLVTIHEFGHYWVARKCGVKVLRFSIGFGKPLFKWLRKTPEGDEVEYVVAAIPLGGYVKMLDEREGDVADDEKNRAFNNQTLSKRVAIVFAGPAFNFILAILLYWLVFMIGSTVARPLLGQVTANSIAAQADFEIKDEVILVGDVKVNSWDEFRLEILDQGLNGGVLPIGVRSAGGMVYKRNLELGEIRLLEKEGDIFKDIGFTRWQPKLDAKIGGVIEGGAAEVAGLRKGDHVLYVDGVSVPHWGFLVEAIRSKPKKLMSFHILRASEEIEVNILPGARETSDGEQGYIGAYQHISDDVRQQLTTYVEYSVFDAISKAVQKTWDMSTLTLRVLWKMITGEAALSNISGPITIATYAGMTASIGLISFLSFLAVISVSLGVLNLLPVPMLDGGHLLYYFIELIKGSPVSETFELIGQQLGIFVLALLMSVAIFNDISRLFQ